MNRVVIFLCLAGILPLQALGQESETPSKGQAYVFFAPGVAKSFGCHSCTSGMLHFGGGGERLLYKGLGIGAELGYLFPTESAGSGVGLVSINGLYSFNRDGKAKVVPFVTGGWSLAFRGGTVNAVNFGGGINYWVKKRLGLRFEFRDHFATAYTSDHIIEGRIGLAFR